LLGVQRCYQHLNPVDGRSSRRKRLSVAHIFSHPTVSFKLLKNTNNTVIPAKAGTQSVVIRKESDAGFDAIPKF
jgi:hypothetical protein